MNALPSSEGIEWGKHHVRVKFGVMLGGAPGFKMVSGEARVDAAEADAAWTFFKPARAMVEVTGDRK